MQWPVFNGTSRGQTMRFKTPVSDVSGGDSVGWERGGTELVILSLPFTPGAHWLLW